MFDWYMALCQAAMIFLGGTISIIILAVATVVVSVELYDAVVERIQKNQNKGEDQ